MTDEARITVTLEYHGKRCVFDRDKSNGHDIGEVLYVWTEGNYSCDCNRSLFFAEHCDGDFPEMPCGETIALVSLVLDGVDLLERERVENRLAAIGLFTPGGYRG